MNLLHRDDNEDAPQVGAESNEGHVGHPLGAMAGFFTPDIVKRAEAFMDKGEALMAKADSVLDDVKLATAEFVKLTGLKK